MDGLKINGVSLFLGYFPHRKQHCFYFEEGNQVTVIAFIPDSSLAEAQRLWAKFIGSIQVGDPRSATETEIRR